MTEQPKPFTIKKLTEVEDVAPRFGFSETQESRFATDDLDAERTGVGHYRLKPNKRQPFGHKHENAEEVYVVVSGSGRVKLNDEIVEIFELDAIRVAPGVMRAFEGGEDGVELIVFGARHAGDGEVVQGWWTD